MIRHDPDPTAAYRFADMSPEKATGLRSALARNGVLADLYDEQGPAMFTDGPGGTVTYGGASSRWTRSTPA